MNTILLLEQTLNGLQLGFTLFLMAAGLTLILGIMNFVNLAHGAFYVLGAYVTVTLQGWTGSFLLGLAAALVIIAIVGALIEMLALRPLFRRSHLDQVLSTVGLLLFLTEMVRVIWGPFPLNAPLPAALSGSVELLPGVPYPTFRLAIIGVGIATAILLYVVIGHTRLGMLIRAGASDRQMIGSMGVNINLLYSIVFGIGVALAGLAGSLAGPLSSVHAGMGDRVLILTLVVIVIGGIGSIKGALIAALLVGLADTLGRTALPSTLASMVIYGFMVAVLYFRPEGLFPARG